jgi:hypothetical protein
MAKAFNVDSSFPCPPSGRRPYDGAYECWLRYDTSGGPRRIDFPMGEVDPTPTPVNELIDGLAERLPYVYREQYADPGPVLLMNKSRFIGVTIVRTCVRPGHGDVKNRLPWDTPRTERLITYIFSNEDVGVIDIEPVRISRLWLSKHGVHSAKKLGSEESDIKLVHFPVSSEEIAASPVVTQAVATQTVRSRAKATDAYAAIHILQPPDGVKPRQIEQIIPGSVISG